MNCIQEIAAAAITLFLFWGTQESLHSVISVTLRLSCMIFSNVRTKPLAMSFPLRPLSFMPEYPITLFCGTAVSSQMIHIEFTFIEKVWNIRQRQSKNVLQIKTYYKFTYTVVNSLCMSLFFVLGTHFWYFVNVTAVFFQFHERNIVHNVL